MKISTIPLSLSQKDIYFDQLHRLSNPMYNIGGYMTLARVDVARLNYAHQMLIRRFAAFGVRICQDNSDVYQIISDDRTTDLPLLDFSSELNPAKTCDDWLRQRFEQPFSLHDSELFSAYLLKLDDDTYRYVGLAHHLIMDGWGFANWTRDLCHFYNQQDPHGNDVWLDNLTQELLYLNSEKYLQDAEYWREQCSAGNDKLFSAFYRGDFDKKKVPSGRAIVNMPSEQSRLIKAFCKEHNLAAPHLLLACLSAYFARAYDTSSLMVGIPSHNRKKYEEKVSLGLFVGVNPLKIRFTEPQLSVVDLAHNIAKQQKKAYRHQRFPLGHVIAQIPGLTDKSELYEVGFNYLKLDSKLNFDGHESQLVYLSAYSGPK